MTKSRITIKDLYRIKFLREIALSPSGEEIAYTVEWLDEKKNKYFSNLYLIDGRRRVRHFIKGDKNVKNLKWSPDGRSLSYFATTEGKTALWLLPVDGGESWPVTRADGIFGEYEWLPDGKAIICEFTKKDAAGRKPAKEPKPPLFYQVTTAVYKLDDLGMLPRDRAHLWRIEIGGGRMTQLTFGPAGDSGPAISADGGTIAFVSNRRRDYEDRPLYIDLWTVSADGKNETRIPAPAGPKWNPVFAPDGEHVAYCGRLHPDDFAGWRQSAIWLVPRRRGPAVNLTEKYPRAIGDAVIDDLGHAAAGKLKFSRDGRYLFFPSTDRGTTYLCRIEIATRRIERLAGDKNRVYAFDYDGDNAAALAISTPTDPGNLYLWQHGPVIKITDLNPWLKAVAPEEFSFPGYRNDRIQAWLLKPPAFRRNKKYPLCVVIHGGPHVGYGNSFFHEFQVLAARGFIVFYSNPHGSMGYGEDFARSLHRRWGIPDTVDITKAVRILKRHGFVDPRRIAVLGGSYGGFMTNWLIGHTTLFRAAVSMRSVVNMVSFFSTDFGRYLGEEFVGDLWKKGNLKFYWNMSPLKYAPRIATPLLIIHSEQDHRCPVTQAEELYVALKTLKKPVEMIKFPGESHELSRHGSPQRRVARIEQILRFLDRHLKPQRRG